MLIFDEKVVYENFQKVAIAKADGERLLYFITMLEDEFLVFKPH